MRMLSLTCRHHPELRWSCKSIAFTPGHGYNGARNIFFFGNDKHEEITEDGTRIRECSCPPTDLILAPGEVYTEEDKKDRGF